MPWVGTRAPPLLSAAAGEVREWLWGDFWVLHFKLGLKILNSECPGREQRFARPGRSVGADSPEIHLLRKITDRDGSKDFTVLLSSLENADSSLLLCALLQTGTRKFGIISAHWESCVSNGKLWSFTLLFPFKPIQFISIKIINKVTACGMFIFLLQCEL